MALVVFLRGVNVGGHKRFRPSLLVQELSDYEVENVGAAGSLVVWKPGPAEEFRAELLRRLPFEAEVALCRGSDLLGVTVDHPFGTEPCRADIVRFVSVRMKTGGARPSLPIAFPAEGEWLVRLIEANGRFVFGEYRRHMKTIGYLGEIDKLFGGQVTTRNWNTIMTIARILQRKQAPRRPPRQRCEEL